MGGIIPTNKYGVAHLPREKFCTSSGILQKYRAGCFHKNLSEEDEQLILLLTLDYCRPKHLCNQVNKLNDKPLGHLK